MSLSDPFAAAFSRSGGALHCESVPLATIAARFGTPTYVYSKRAIVVAFQTYARALAGRPSLVCYAMKANSNLAVLRLLAQMGAGFDIVSGGELARVLAAGGDPAKIVFSGVGKSEEEVRAALAADIMCFNLESAEELDRLQHVAREADVRARISVRTNPDVDAHTHPYITTGLKQNKFGVALDETLALYRRAARLPNIEVVGIDCHIGSQITAVRPYVDAADKVLDLVDALQREGIELRHIDFGGGLGISYRDETPPPADTLIGAMLARVDQRGHADKHILVEPGRSIVGAAGALLTQVNIVKASDVKNFAIVDAAMNDLMRPALYQAWMDVQPVCVRDEPPQRYDIVGPVCESGDWLARDRDLALRSGDLLAVLSAGAYGMSMASNYNSRPRAAEVMVDGDQVHLIRRRETIEQLFADESMLPD